MANFLSRLLGRPNDAVTPRAAGLQQLTSESRKKSGRREPPAELDWSRVEYIPMPPSPPYGERKVKTSPTAGTTTRRLHR